MSDDLLNLQLVSGSELLPAAENRMQEILKLPDDGRALTKLNFRADMCREWEEFATEEPQSGWQMLSSPAMIKTLENYMRALGGKKKSKL